MHIKASCGVIKWVMTPTLLKYKTISTRESILGVRVSAVHGLVQKVSEEREGMPIPLALTHTNARILHGWLGLFRRCSSMEKFTA
eukprot:5999312-Amphidinium_carterae.1